MASALRKLAMGELIGQKIEVCQSKNKTLNGLQGKIIDETKNTLTLETAKGRKRLIKAMVKLKFISQGLVVDGKALAKRPEERIKAKHEN